MEQSNILIYQTDDGQTKIETRLVNDTVWLSLEQMSELFDKGRSTINEHILNIFKENELSKADSIRKIGISDFSTKPTNYYNLDVIISVGYRVKSVQGTKFRQWATKRLNDYLLKGYAINQTRLEQLNKIVNVIQQSGVLDGVQLSEAKGLLDILSNYTRSFVLLNQYDSNSLSNEGLDTNITYEIQYAEAKDAIKELKMQLVTKNSANDLFGNEKDNSFEGTLNSVVQTFGGEYLYPTIEEQAAHLLYFIIKNHPFSDGNKRIGAFLFVWFLDKNKHASKNNGEIKINDNALIALALLIAQSNPSEKDLMVSLVCNLIKNGN
jgi:prophage maintenance system killer protein